MSITNDDDLLPGAPGAGQTNSAEPDTGQSGKPRVVAWLEQIPRARRATDFDDVAADVRQGTPGLWAEIDQDGSPITPNKVSTLKKRYPDLEFKQAGKQTFARVRQD